MRKILLLATICSFFSRASSAQSTYFPPNGSSVWDTTSYSSLGWCGGAAIDSLYNFLELRNSKSFMILHDGKIVLEKYFDGHGVDSNWYWASAGKTLIAMAIGIAQQNGQVNINNKVSNYLGTGWTSCTTAQEDSITLKDLLTMTSGLNDLVFDDNCVEDTCLKYLAPVNTRWAYYNAPYRLLQNVIDSATVPTCNAYLNQNIRNVIGMNGAMINFVNYSTTRSFARFGHLLLNKGKWAGVTLLSDTNYFNAMVNSSQSINPAYGYLTWLNGKSKYILPQSQLVFSGKLAPNAPDDMYAALGKDGQVINVVPSQKLVVVRMGNNPMDGSLVPTTFNNELWFYLNKIVCPPTAISSVQEKTISIYPNPANNQITVANAPINSTLLVYNQTGNLVHSVVLNSKQQVVDISTLASGLYLAIVTGQSIKFVKE
jgi:CubicO group peptidase (beta-lactamase class C family)